MFILFWIIYKMVFIIWTSKISGKILIDIIDLFAIKHQFCFNKHEFCLTNDLIFKGDYLNLIPKIIKIKINVFQECGKIAFTLQITIEI